MSSIKKYLQTDIKLAPFTTFKIGGPADYFFVAHTTKDVINAVQWARSKNLPFFILGKGANILIGDKGFRGLVIKNEAKSVKFKGNLVTADSGITIEELIKKTLGKNFSGLEHFAGIPSTLGGAIWQNLHFLSPDRESTMFIADIVKSATIFNQSNEVKIVENKYFKFGYDQSILHENKDIVLTITLQLKKEKKQIIQQTILNNLTWRNEKHPEYAAERSAGSIFKKLEGHGAGRLIEQASLKGMRIGGAQVADRHANFILNVDGATAYDVQSLIKHIQEKVKQKTCLNLTPEISFIGEFTE